VIRDDCKKNKKRVKTENLSAGKAGSFPEVRCDAGEAEPNPNMIRTKDKKETIGAIKKKMGRGESGNISDNSAKLKG